MYDYDQELTMEIAFQIHKATETILKRFEPVQSPSDFTDSEAGMEKLDSICMQLIAIGEGLKNLDKVTHYSLLLRYPQKWNGGRSQLVNLLGLMRYFGRLERMERIQLKQRALERCEARLRKEK